MLPYLNGTNLPLCAAIDMVELSVKTETNTFNFITVTFISFLFLFYFFLISGAKLGKYFGIASFLERKMQKSKKILAILLIFRKNETKKTDSQEEIRLLYCILSMCLGFSKKVPRFLEKCPEEI